MILIGDFNELKVLRETDFGFFLEGGTGNSSDDILLPRRNALSDKINIGDTLNTFIYRDSEDRLVATLNIPKAKVGDMAYLKVLSNTNLGSFVDFGLEKDIFVPFREQLYELKEGNSYLFYIYLDKTHRLAATTKIDPHLDSSSEYKIGDTLDGIIYGFQTNGSAMVAIDKKYKGVILFNEFFQSYEEGNIISLRVIKLYEDGKLGLTPRKQIIEERDILGQEILSYLNKNDGFMPLNDKSSPEEIYKIFHQSKNYFKSALGGLMKKKLISQDSTGTRLI